MVRHTEYALAKILEDTLDEELEMISQPPAYKVLV